jgi:uncharacterized protein YjaZ
MNRIFNFVFLFFISVLSQSCWRPISNENIEINESLVKIPLILIYSSEKEQKKYEKKLLEMIDFTNEIYNKSGVYFYVKKSEIRKYDKKFIRSKNQIKNMSKIHKNAISIFVVDSIQYNKNYYGGYAVHENICEKFVVIRGPRTPGKVILAHEIGHLMGLRHSTQHHNLMESLVEPNVFISKQQENTVKRQSIHYYRKCLFI